MSRLHWQLHRRPDLLYKIGKRKLRLELKEGALRCMAANFSSPTCSTSVRSPAPVEHNPAAPTPWTCSTLPVRMDDVRHKIVGVEVVVVLSCRAPPTSPQSTSPHAPSPLLIDELRSQASMICGPSNERDSQTMYSAESSNPSYPVPLALGNMVYPNNTFSVTAFDGWGTQQNEEYAVRGFIDYLEF